MKQKENITYKLKKLKQTLKQMGSVLVAYSGGVDSTFLLKIAKDVLGKNVLAVTATSETYTKSELAQAKKIAGEIGVSHLILKTHEFHNPGFRNNSLNRCYYCKKELFSKLKQIAKEKNIKYVADASNYDDLKDFRPGAKAAKELGVSSPLKEAYFTKQDIRILSRKMKLPTWDKPSLACLASRIPYGTQITKQRLNMVEQAEKYLHCFGIKQVRVRLHGNTARIEVPQGEMKVLYSADTRKKIVDKFKRIGYKYITLDLQGYRTGSMNEVAVSGQR